MSYNGDGILANIQKVKPQIYKKLTYQMLKQFLRKVSVNFKKHTVGTQDLNGNELAIGDRILVCVEKDYGWLGYATIIGESKLTWRIKLEDATVYNQTRNFDKNSKRILKA